MTSPSPLKSETARANGAQSHGPVTPEGKAASAQNSLRHGLCAKQVVLPGEDQDAFDRLRADYASSFRPQGEAEQDLVETIASAAWRLKRIIRLEAVLLSDENTDPAKTLSLLVRYENQLNRTYDLSLKRLKMLQENRVHATAPSRLRNEPKPAPSTSHARDFKGLLQAAMSIPTARPALFNPALKSPGASKEGAA